jgi:hypothetical protein
MTITTDLQLNRKLQNSAFQSWRLAPSPCLISQHEISLPGHVATINVSATDYLHTRHATLRNHLLEVTEGTQRRIFSFLRAEGTESLLLTEIVLKEVAGSSDDVFVIKKIAGRYRGSSNWSDVLNSCSSRVHGLSVHTQLLLIPPCSVHGLLLLLIFWDDSIKI